MYPVEVEHIPLPEDQLLYKDVARPVADVTENEPQDLREYSCWERVKSLSSMLLCLRGG